MKREGLGALGIAGAVLVGLAATVAPAATIYVSPRGSDDANGAAAAPVATVEQALSLANASDSILLRGGRYELDHFLWIDKPGVTIGSFPGERAILAAPTADPATVPAAIIIVADRVTLSDLEIQGGGHYAVKVDADNDKPTSGVAIRHCRIGGSGADCIKTFNADGLLIEDCDIGPSGVRDPSNAEGIDSIGSKGITIRRCHVHDTATNGIYLKGGATHGVVEACLVERTGKFAGILLGQDTDEEFMRDGARYEASDCVARNNIIVNTGSAGVGTYSGRGIRFDNNTLVNVASQGQAALWVVTNSRHVPAERVTFRNNIVVMASDRPLIFVLDMADALVSDHNLYFSPHAAPSFRCESGGQVQTWDLAGWQQHMHADLHSRTGDPLLEERQQYRPGDGSPALGAGKALAEVPTDYAGRARPRSGACDIGAQQRLASPPGNTAAKPSEGAQ